MWGDPFRELAKPVCCLPLLPAPAASPLLPLPLLLSLITILPLLSGLITATRHRPYTSTGRMHASAEEARVGGLLEYRALVEATGGHDVALARMLGLDER